MWGDFMDYDELTNKPSLNGVTLEGDMELEDVGIVELTPEMVAELYLETYGFIL
jgi:hypothetical protein